MDGAPSNSDSSETRRRVWLAVIVAFVYGLACWRPDWVSLAGVSHLGVWFLDTRALLAASDAVTLGLDPYANNPLDFFRQPHVYSSWWFALASLGLTRADYLWLGTILVFGFLATALLQVRVRSLGELLWSAAFLISPPLLLGFNRANADLLVFILLSTVVPLLLAHLRALHWLALVVILFAAGLKFYPFAAAGVLLFAGRSWRETTWLLAVAFGLGVLLALDQQESLKAYVSQTKQPSGLFTFGLGVTPTLQHWPEWTTPTLAIVFLLGSVTIWWRHAPVWEIPQALRREHLGFILGATLLGACYLVTINYSYRAVFAIWMVPFLWRAWKAEHWPPFFRRLGRVAGVLLLVLVWFDGLACLAINLTGPHSTVAIDGWMDRCLLAQQPIVAVLMIALLGFLVAAARDILPGRTANDRRDAASLEGRAT